MTKPVKDPKNKLLEQLLEEIDELKEKANVREMKLETLNFRCEKLQEDITKKHDQLASLKNSNSDKADRIHNLSMKLAKSEKENRINRENIAPRLDALKSRYEVCMLEMVSLENDNRILNDRVNSLLKENSELRRLNRQLKKDKFEEKQQRLELCKEFEKVKREFDELTDKLEDINLERDDLEEANKRVKNERETYMKKLEVIERENYRLSTVGANLKGVRNSFEGAIEDDHPIDSKDTVFLDLEKDRNNTRSRRIRNRYTTEEPKSNKHIILNLTVSNII